MSEEFHTSSSVPTVIVVIPIYTTALSDAELSALRHNLRVLASHDTVVVKPESLDLTPLYTALGMEPSWRVESFPDEFFAGRKGYNRLMMSEVFYKRFLAWEYLLIMQTDVYVFSDRLDAWCARGYDYVGAPWLPSIREVTGFHPLHRLAWRFRCLKAKFTRGFTPLDLKWKSGNGGFSLRRVSKLHAIAHEHRDAITAIADGSDRSENFEDVFWSVRANELSPGALRIAPWREALDFAVESHPMMAMRETGGKLPMGTHAYTRRRNQREWRHYTDFPE